MPQVWQAHPPHPIPQQHATTNAALRLPLPTQTHPTRNEPPTMTGTTINSIAIILIGITLIWHMADHR